MTRLRSLGRYLLARIKEPGTMRSLVWVALGIASGARAETLVDDLAALALVVLGGVSALKPETKPVVVVADTLTAGTVVVEPKP